jgi:putative flippase GtrA
MLKSFYQLVRFLGIGFLNTAVDFTVLNLLAVSFGLYTGLGVGVINVISFSAAVLHSYFWNKHWAFGNKQSQDEFWRNFSQAAVAGFLGAAVLVLAVVGAAMKLKFSFFLLLLLILFFGELALWKIFGLAAKPLAARSDKEFLLFLAVSVIGTLLNSGIVASATAFFPPQFGMSQQLWTNLIKAGATAISLIWNFSGFKLLVFRR